MAWFQLYVINDSFFPGSPRAPIGYYFLCGRHTGPVCFTLTSHLPQERYSENFLYIENLILLVTKAGEKIYYYYKSINNKILYYLQFHKSDVSS